MKRKISILIIGLTAISALLFNSCKKKDDTTATPAAANGTLYFHLHTDVDTAEVANLDSVYVMSSHRKISVHFAQLYLSNIQLIKLDGSSVSVAGVIVLKKQQIEPYLLGSVPSGNYQSVSFDVGLVSATNVTVPMPSDSAQFSQQMWYSATAQPSGYVFVNFQGKIDTTTAANGSVTSMQPFSYKIGTNDNLKTVTMPVQDFTVSPNQTQYVHIICDYSKLFTGIPLNVNSNLTMNTYPANATALGMQLANNVPLMFRYEY